MDGRISSRAEIGATHLKMLVRIDRLVGRKEKGEDSSDRWTV